YMKKSYILAAIFISIAFVHLAMGEILQLRKEYPNIAFVCTVISLLPITFIFSSPWPRGTVQISIPIALIIVELWAIATMLRITPLRPSHVMSSFLAAITLMTVCYALGANLPLRVLPGEIAIFFVIVLFAMACIILMGLSMESTKLLFSPVFFQILGVFLIPSILYHGQIVHSRVFTLPPNLYVISATAVYLQFILLLTSIYFLVWTELG
ncbi:hypothetical protein KR018_000961, partial [Drosophila ironensis]